MFMNSGQTAFLITSMWIGYDTRCHVFIPTDIHRLKETDLAVAQGWGESLRRNLVSFFE